MWSKEVQNQYFLLKTRGFHSLLKKIVSRKVKNVAKFVSMRRAALVQGLDGSLAKEERLLTKLRRHRPNQPRAPSGKRGPGAQPQAFFYPRGGL